MRALLKPNTPVRVLLVLSFFCAVLPIQTADLPLGRVMGFAYQNHLTMGIGKYDPTDGWLSLAGLYRMSEPGDMFTIYTMAGEVGRVKNIDAHRSGSYQTPVEWSALVSTWPYTIENPYGLALFGASPVPAEPAVEIAGDDPEIVTEVASYLKKRGLDVPHPLITKAYRVKLSANEPEAILVTAHSATRGLKNDDALTMYALALVLEKSDQGWKATPLEQQTSYKPRSQTLEENQRYYGPSEVYRLLACLDIDGDGTKEVVVYISRVEATQIDVFSKKGKQFRKVVSVYKHLFN